MCVSWHSQALGHLVSSSFLSAHGENNLSLLSPPHSFLPSSLRLTSASHSWLIPHQWGGYVKTREAGQARVCELHAACALLAMRC